VRFTQPTEELNKTKIQASTRKGEFASKLPSGFMCAIDSSGSPFWLAFHPEMHH
jgi:hypothetical protein